MKYISSLLLIAAIIGSGFAQTTVTDTSFFHNRRMIIVQEKADSTYNLGYNKLIKFVYFVRSENNLIPVLSSDYCIRDSADYLCKNRIFPAKFFIRKFYPSEIELSWITQRKSYNILSQKQPKLQSVEIALYVAGVNYIINIGIDTTLNKENTISIVSYEKDEDKKEYISYLSTGSSFVNEAHFNLKKGAGLNIDFRSSGTKYDVFYVDTDGHQRLFKMYFDIDYEIDSIIKGDKTEGLYFKSEFFDNSLCKFSSRFCTDDGGTWLIDTCNYSTGGN